MSNVANEVAVSVTGLSKRYRIGLREQSESLVGAVARGAVAPLRSFVQLRRMRHFGEDDEAGVVWALRDVGFELDHGEVLGVIGRNGAGKSTLLKILSRITEPTEGQAMLRGRVASLLEVGTGFHGDLTGRENIFLNGSMLGMRRREIVGRFEEIVEFAGIEQYLDTPVKRYSSGMAMRLAFAVAAHVDPDVLIADEVLAVGDAEFQRKCLGKMREVASSGRTVIFVSHNQASIASLCTRALWLERGRTRMDGPVDEVASRYLASVAAHDDGILADRTDRSGTGALRFVRAEVRDAQCAPTRTLVAGEPASVVLEYSSSTPLRAVEVWLYIDSSLGERVATFSNEWTGDELSGLPAGGRIVCRLDELPLNGGDYSCSLKAKVNGVSADHLSDALSFTVDATRFYPTRRHPLMQAGPLLLSGRWGLDE
jgi:lipopolysaccharide transport system ATP-binding protein